MVRRRRPVGQKNKGRNHPALRLPPPVPIGAMLAKRSECSPPHRQQPSLPVFPLAYSSTMSVVAFGDRAVAGSLALFHQPPRDVNRPRLSRPSFAVAIFSAPSRRSIVVSLISSR